MFVYDQAGEHPCGALLQHILLLYGIEGCGGCVPLSSWLGIALSMVCCMPFWQA